MMYMIPTPIKKASIVVATVTFFMSDLSFPSIRAVRLRIRDTWFSLGESLVLCFCFLSLRTQAKIRRTNL